MRRGVALLLVLLAGGVAPRLFRAPLFLALPSCSHSHAPTRTHALSRVPMGSHLTPIAQNQPASLALTHPNPPKNRKKRKFSGTGGTKPGAPSRPGAIFAEAPTPLSEAAPTHPHTYAYQRRYAT